MKKITKEELIDVLEKYPISEAPIILGMSQSTLWRKRIKFGLAFTERHLRNGLYKDIKREDIVESLSELGGVCRAANFLGISEKTLSLKMKKFGIKKNKNKNWE